MTSEYGTYRLTFEPPADQITPSVEMTLSGEADVDQMLAMFEAFMQASGYVLKGDIRVVERAPEYDPWSITSYGSQATDFVSFSSFSDDVISFEQQPWDENLLSK